MAVLASLVLACIHNVGIWRAEDFKSNKQDAKPFTLCLSGGDRATELHLIWECNSWQEVRVEMIQREARRGNSRIRKLIDVC